MSAPYLRIVDEIRDRISSGQLEPGDRIPSARQITREWGVAIATATKVLAALTAEGLARPVMGVGTVVAPAVDPPQETPQGTGARVRRPAEVELSRERIVQTAIRVADEEGLPALTMRRLAIELDVAVMSLYRHVANKDELVLLMSDAVWGKVDPATLRGDTPRARLEAVARGQWGMSRLHPWLPSVMSLNRPMLVPNGMVMTEFSMRAVHEAGYDLVTSLRVAVALAGFVLGIASSVQLDVDAERETGQTADEYMQAQDAAFTDIASGRFPMLLAVGEIPDFDLDLDSVFEMGLTLFLDGFERLARPRFGRTWDEIAGVFPKEEDPTWQADQDRVDRAIQDPWSRG